MEQQLDYHHRLHRYSARQNRLKGVALWNVNFSNSCGTVRITDVLLPALAKPYSL